MNTNEARGSWSRVHPLAASLAVALCVSLPARGQAGPTRVAHVGHGDHAAPARHAVRLVGPSPATTLGITRVVTNCNDNGAGSLREAYSQAANNDTIDLTQLACSRISLTTGALTDAGGTANVTLIGPAAGQFVIDGKSSGRVLVHNGYGALELDRVNVVNGTYNGMDVGGGCIYSYGSVVISKGKVSSCRTTGASNAARGGAIFAHGEVAVISGNVSGSSAYSHDGHSAGGGIWANAVNLRYSTVSGSSASSYRSYALGGGIFAAYKVDSRYSTVSGNQASEGGGIFGYRVKLTNSTISGNSAFAAGGIYAHLYASVYNSTITRNTADIESYAAGLFCHFATISLQSSIIAGNTVGAAGSDIGSAASADLFGANNLVLAPAAGIRLPDDTIVGDPALGPLQDNGGPTLTHAPLPRSLAINSGNNSQGILFDQRRSHREVGGRADIGAVEVTERIFNDGFEPNVAVIN